MPDDILNRIDDTLDDWNGSADSARWAGGPEESEWRDELPVTLEAFARPELERLPWRPWLRQRRGA